MSYASPRLGTAGRRTAAGSLFVFEHVFRRSHLPVGKLNAVPPTAFGWIVEEAQDTQVPKRKIVTIGKTKLDIDKGVLTKVELGGTREAVLLHGSNTELAK